MIKQFLFILNFVLTICCASDVVSLRNPTTEEIQTINEHMLNFYADELMTAGLFKDKKMALAAAKNETNLQDSSAIYIIASEDIETKYGYIIYENKEHSAYVDALFIEEEFRGKGLGKKAIDLFEKELVQKGIHEVELFVFAHNTIALKLYEKMGYTVVSSYTGENGQPTGALMQKKLSASQK